MKTNFFKFEAIADWIYVLSRLWIDKNMYFRKVLVESHKLDEKKKKRSINNVVYFSTLSF